ncbi:MAG: hypothetical protein HON53_24325 [Planctomycetaceae bacterium]|jgi:hypothetical protein|nr:hypothetical protein [Planctomycetaceae bacterium]MBT6155953.1 hypothetical protein [Planctomycetaceae bacterium]MBT6483132.1 hypothetical protein [Planctomycetaceae bacterium]MBT6497734.1 hypothetical protein [Planctomycetaceae bacterium]
MASFDELVTSRRAWIDDVLQPWCRDAALADLLKAEAEWNDIAGRVDSAATLWTWAWGRFPALVHEELSGVNETREVRLTLSDGREVAGYPDARSCESGRLLLLESSTSGNQEHGPYSIDEIAAVVAVECG